MSGSGLLWLVLHCSGLSGLIEEDGCGDGGVEAFDRAWAGDGDAVLAAGGDFRREARAFRADDEGKRASERKAVERLGIVGHGGEGLDARSVELCEALLGGGVEDGQTKDASGGGAEGFGVPWADGAGKENGSRGTKGLGGSENGAEVAGVLESGEDDEQRVGLVEEEIPGPVGLLDERGNGLGRFRGDGGGEDVGRDGEDFDVGGNFERIERGFPACGDKDGFYRDAAGEGFFEEVKAFDGNQAVGVGLRFEQQGAELFEARVLLAQDGADWGHGGDLNWLWLDCIPCGIGSAQMASGGDSVAFGMFTM